MSKRSNSPVAADHPPTKHSKSVKHAPSLMNFKTSSLTLKGVCPGNKGDKFVPVVCKEPGPLANPCFDTSKAPNYNIAPFAASSYTSDNNADGDLGYAVELNEEEAEHLKKEFADLVELMIPRKEEFLGKRAKSTTDDMFRRDFISPLKEPDPEKSHTTYILNCKIPGASSKLPANIKLTDLLENGQISPEIIGDVSDLQRPMSAVNLTLGIRRGIWFSPATYKWGIKLTVESALVYLNMSRKRGAQPDLSNVVIDNTAKTDISQRNCYVKLEEEVPLPLETIKAPSYQFGDDHESPSRH